MLSPAIGLASLRSPSRSPPAGGTEHFCSAPHTAPVPGLVDYHRSPEGFPVGPWARRSVWKRHLPQTASLPANVASRDRSHRPVSPPTGFFTPQSIFLHFGDTSPQFQRQMSQIHAATAWKALGATRAGRCLPWLGISAPREGALQVPPALQQPPEPPNPFHSHKRLAPSTRCKSSSAEDVLCLPQGSPISPASTNEDAEVAEREGSHFLHQLVTDT